MTESNCNFPPKNLRVCVSGGHRDGNDPLYVEECYKLGAKIAKMGFRLDYGFSNSGVMGAVARGVLDNWEERKDKYYSDVAPIVGVTTKEYYELYEKDEFLQQISEVVLEDTLENRKIRLLEADIVVFAPGGVGTLDELAYDCVAMQDGFLKIKPFSIQNQIRHVLDQRLDHLIGGLYVIKSGERNCVLHSGIVCIKGEDVGNTHIGQLLQHHGAVQRLSGASLVLSALVQHGHDYVDTSCLAADGADDSLQIGKMIVGTHGNGLTVHLIGDAVIEHVANNEYVSAAHSIVKQTLTLAASETGTFRSDREALIGAVPFL